MRICAPLAATAIACGHPVAPAPPPDPLWAAATIVVGDGGEHLPAPARALVALDASHALAALDGGGLAVIDLDRGETARAVHGAIDGEVAALARLRDGRVLAVGGGKDRERAWWIDPRSLVARAVDVGGASGGDSVRAASGVAASSDGRAIVITGVRLPLALRDPRDLSITRVLSPERNWANPVFVDDSYLIAFHHGTVVPFDLGSGHMAVDRPWDSSIGFTSPDGLALVHPPDRVGLELTDLHDPAFKVALSSADPVDVAWSPDGQHLVVIDSDRAVAYDVPGGDGHPIAVPGTRSRAVFGADGRRLVITAAGALWRVDPSTGRADGPRGPGAGEVAFVAPTAGGMIAISDRWRAIDARARVGASGGWRGLGGPAFSVSPNGAFVAASSVAGGEVFVEVWDAATGTSRAAAVVDGGVLALDVHDEGGVDIATPDGLVLMSGSAEHQLEPPLWGSPVDVAHHVLAYARAGSIAVFDYTGDAPPVKLGAFDCDAAAIARLSRDGSRLAIVDGDRFAIVDLAAGASAGASARTARWPGSIRAFALDATRVIAATDDRLILWEPGAAAATAIAMPARVTAIAIDGDRIALGFADGRAGTWTIEALRALAHPTALATAGALPARCPGEPLSAADEGTPAPRVQRLPGK